MRPVSRYILYATVAAALVVAAVLVFTRRKGVNPVKGRVSSGYGIRNGSLHNGTDIAVSVGTRVRSPWRGTVADVYSNASGGLQVVIDHPNSYRTGYAHLSSSGVVKGDKVSRGQAFARSGNSGNSTGPHLHFTLRKNGNLVDPETMFNFK